MSLLARLGGTSSLGSASCGGGVARAGACDLESNVATEGTGAVVVDDLHQTEVAHAAGCIGSGASEAGRNLDGEWLEMWSVHRQSTARRERVTYCISTDVGGTLLDTNGLQGPCDHALDHVALSISDHVRSGRQLCALGVCASAGLVDHGEEVSALVVGSAIAGDDSPSAGDGTGAVGGDLRQRVAGQGHGGLQIRDRELAVGGGLAETILHRVVGVAAEDGGVLFGLRVLSEPGDGCTLDAESGAITTLVATRCAKCQYEYIG